jgi:hypothetical protein
MPPRGGVLVLRHRIRFDCQAVAQINKVQTMKKASAKPDALFVL